MGIVPLLTFLLEAVLVSLSGVMAPGPITAVTIGKGSDSPHAGALVAVGHGIVEFPLMIAIFYGFGRVFTLTFIRVTIALAGGVLLALMGVGMFRSVSKAHATPSDYAHSPLVAGVLLSAGSPYFLIWWATVGAALILRSTEFGTAGFLAFAALHWSCDFLWCYFLSALSFTGGHFFGRRFQKTIFAICGVFLLLFSFRSIADGISLLAQ